MKTLKKLTLFALLALSLAQTACQEDVDTLDRTGKVGVLQPSRPGDFTDDPDALPGVKIIRRTYIPSSSLFAHTHCHAVRIEWPEYDEDADPEMIPDLLATATQSLYDVNYLYNDPAKKANLDFSLYRENKLQTPYNTPGLYPLGGYTGDNPRFAKYNASLETIKKMAIERPSLFESYYKDTMGAKPDEVDYQAGDFFLVWLSEKNRYGGVRIVSETPRIIEVYIAEPNQ